jgi:putative ABC transport system permease protein
MTSLTIRGLWAHKLRFALTGLAVVLGVAFMAGTMVLTDTMQKTFDGVFAAGNDGIDAIVRHDSAIDGDFAAARERVDASVVDEVAGIDGVASAAGTIQGFAQLVHADGAAAATDGLGATLGANWIDDERLNPFTLDEGRAPRAADEAVIDKRTAADEGWALGDELSILTKAGPRTLTLVGTATYGAVDGLPGTTLVATDDATAQELFAEPGRYDAVLATADGIAAADLAARLTDQIATSGSGLEAITGEADTADKQADFKEDLAFFNQFLMAFAFVALFVGTFIIYNTFSIVVAQRIKDLAMLRAIGARRWQVLRSIILESVVVGVAASAVGLLAGVGMSFGLRALLAQVGLEIPSGPLTISSGTIQTAFLVGVTVSVVSAVAPAIRASRIKPIAALRDVAVDRSGVSIGRVLTGLVVTGAGVVGFAAGLTADGDSALPLIGLGAMLTILGVFVLGPILARPVVRLLGAPVRRLSGVTGRYAQENAHRNPKRTAATASALMIGVALVGFITILAASTKSSVSSAVDMSFRADFVVDSGSWDKGFATTVEGDLAGVPEVEALSPLRTAPVSRDGATTDIQAVDTAAFEQLYDLEVADGSLADVGTDGIAVKSDAIDADGTPLAIGDTVSFTFAGGEQVDLEVRAIFDGTIEGGGVSTWLIDLTTFEAHVADVFDRMLFVTVADGTTAAEARTAIEDAMEAWPNAEIQDQAEFKESVTAEIDMMLNLIYGLLALAVVIALIGIANTLALSIHERTREIGLLRAVGMHRSQVRSAVRWESLLIALLGAGLGAVLAVGGAYGIVKALDSEGVTQLTIPVTQMVVILGMAALAGVLAATGPARRAGKLDVLTAIASD